MKIVFVINDINFLVSHRYELYEKLRENGYDLFVISGNKNIKREYRNKLKSINFTQIDFNTSEKSPIKILFSILKIIKIIKKINPSIIHTVSPIGNLLGGVASIFFKETHLITAISGRGTLYINKKLKIKLMKHIFSFCEFIYLNKKYSSTITQNSFDRKDIESKQLTKKRNILIMGSGVNLTTFFPRKINKMYDFCFIGRLTKDKGILDFIDAATFAYNKDNNMKFVVVGEMPQENLKLCNYIESQLRSKKFIYYEGFKTNLSYYYNVSKMLCLPSRREGMPKVVLEASACGTPSITYDVIGCSEAIISGVNGFLVKQVDSVSLGKAMLEELKKNNFSKLSETSRLHAEKNFSIKSVISLHLKLYESILDI